MTILPIYRIISRPTHSFLFVLQIKLVEKSNHQSLIIASLNPNFIKALIEVEANVLVKF